MNCRIGLAFVLVSLIVSAFICALPVQAQPFGNVYIKADGSIVGTDKIRRDGEIYTFLGDVSSNLTVESDSIVIDGAGYALKPEVSHDSLALILDGRTNVTVQNLVINNSGSGINLNQTNNCKIISNTITVNQSAIQLRNSNNNTIIGNSIQATLRGIALLNSSNNVISENEITIEAFVAIDIYTSSNNIIQKNNLTSRKDLPIAPISFGIQLGGFRTNSTSNNKIIENNICGYNGEGIMLQSVDYNEISGNNLTGNEEGMHIQSSSNNRILANNLTGNNVGIVLELGSNNILKDNQLTNNKNAFKAYGDMPPDWIHDVDTSNKVDGKPIYYMINEHDRTVPSDAGCVILVNCANMTVQDLDLSAKGQGVTLAFTLNSTITRNILTDNMAGIWMISSSNNTITENNVSANTYGVCLPARNDIPCTNNYVARNLIANCDRGIWLSATSNSFVENNITNNNAGVWIQGAPNNTFLRNNFDNNTKNVDDQAIYAGGFLGAPSLNAWDDGHSKGNYWSAYTGVDANGDGVGDTPYIVNEENQDHYPLMQPVDINTSLPSPKPNQSPSSPDESPQPSASTSQEPTQSPESKEQPLPPVDLSIALVAVIAVTLIAAASALVLRKHRKGNQNRSKQVMN
jgi:parallel beta-helix repeat protein